MYDVVKDIKDCRCIVSKNLQGDEHLYSLEHAYVGTQYTCTQFPITAEFLEEMKNVYNNITVESEGYHNNAMTKDSDFHLEVFQDYGDGSRDVDGYQEIPSALLDFTYQANVCWLNGYLGLIKRKGSTLCVTELTPAPRIFSEPFDAKRPYDYQLARAGENIYLLIHTNKQIIIPLPYTYSDLTTVQNLTSAMNMVADSAEGWFDDNNEFLSRDYFALNGWNLIDGVWRKEDKEIEDSLNDGCYFYYRGKPVFYKREIEDGN